MGVSKGKKKEKERGSSTTVRSVGEGEGTLWSKRTAPKRSNDEYRGVDNAKRSSDLYRV